MGGRGAKPPLPRGRNIPSFAHSAQAMGLEDVLTASRARSEADGMLLKLTPLFSSRPDSA
jgi:hypothetical protein